MSVTLNQFLVFLFSAEEVNGANCEGVDNVINVFSLFFLLNL